MPFISYLVAPVRTSVSMLNRSGETEHSYIIPDLRGKMFIFFFKPLSMTLAVGLSYMAFIMLRYISFIPSLLNFFYHKWMLNFFKCFFCIHCDDDVFLSFIVLMCYIPFIDLHMLNHLCIPDINPFNHGMQSFYYVFLNIANMVC